MNVFKINGKTVKFPEGRHEVDYKKWSDAYVWINKAKEVQEEGEEGNKIIASKKAFDYIIRIMSILSDKITYAELVDAPALSIQNIWLRSIILEINYDENKRI